LRIWARGRGEEGDGWDECADEARWLALEKPTIADVSIFLYVALAPMGDVRLEPYPWVVEWIEKVKGLEGFVGMMGLEDPVDRKR
jgi:glutathione S-transferase